MIRLQTQRNVQAPQNSQDKTALGSPKKLKRENNEDQTVTSKSNVKKAFDKTRQGFGRHSSLQYLPIKKKGRNETPSPKRDAKKGKSLQNVDVKEKSRIKERNISPPTSKGAINSSEYVNRNDKGKKSERKDISPLRNNYFQANSLQNLPSFKKKTRKRDLNETSRKYDDSDSSDASLLTRPKSNLLQRDTYNLTIDRRKRSPSPSKKNSETNFTKRFLGFVSHNTSVDKKKPKRPEKRSKPHRSDSKTKRMIISEVKKYNTKELKRNKVPPQVTQTRESSFNRLLNSSEHKYGSKLKRKMRKQVWHWAKKAIKNNEHWSSLFAENHINIDNINIDKLDLSLFDVDALEIENKFIKRAVIWMLK